MFLSREIGLFLGHYNLRSPHFLQKSSVTPKVSTIYQKVFSNWYQNLFLNFQKFEKLKIKKRFPKIMRFCFSSV